MKDFFHEHGLLINEKGISFQPGSGPTAEPAKHLSWSQVYSIALRRPGLRWALWSKSKEVQLVINGSTLMFTTHDEDQVERLNSAIGQATELRGKGQHLGYRTK